MERGNPGTQEAGAERSTADLELIPRSRAKLAYCVRQCLLLYPVRVFVCFVRQFWFRRVLGRLRVFSEAGAGVAAPTVQHNLGGLKEYAGSQTLRVIRPLSCIESVTPASRILSIGPRTEGELLCLIGHGFRPGNVRGVDLISYSPWIDLGDMHALPYPDSSYDVVISSRTLPYSKDQALAISEMLRVVRPGGIIAVNLDYAPGAANSDYGQPIQSTADLLAHFAGKVEHVYWLHDVPARDRIGSVSAVFSVKKP